MYLPELTIAAVFAAGLALAIPLGRIFGVQLQPGRYTHIDGMRAIAAMMVMSSHYSKTIMVIANDTNFPPLVTALGDIGVQIFFCVTGFLFTRKALAGPVDIPKFVVSRVRRIVPLYLFCMTIAVAIATWISVKQKGYLTFHFSDILYAYGTGFTGYPVGDMQGVSLLGIIGQVWTLHWEWLFYLCVPFLSAIFVKPKWFGWLSLFIVLCAIFQVRIAPQVWLYFIPGALCGLAERKIKISTSAQILLAVIGIACFAASLTSNLVSYGLVEFALCLVGFPSLLFGHRWLLSLKPLRTLGEVSYSIYLTHLFVPAVFWAIVNYVAPQHFGTVGPKFELAMYIAPLTFPLFFVAYALVERPFMARREKGVTDQIAQSRAEA